MYKLSPYYGDYYSKYLNAFHLSGTTLWAGGRALKAKGISLTKLWPNKKLKILMKQMK